MEILRFWRFLRRRYRILFFTVVPLVIISLIMSLLLKPVYKSTVSIWINAKAITPDYISSLPSGLGRLNYVDTESVVDTFKKLIGSKSTLNSVIEKLNIKSGGGLIPADRFFEPNKIALYLFQKKGIKVEQDGDSELLNITAYSTDAKKAVEISNEVLDSFSKLFYNFNKDDARKAKAFLESEMRRVEAKWLKAENIKKDFMNRNNILSLDSLKNTLTSRIAGVEADITATKLVIKKERRGVEEVQKKLKQYPEFVDSGLTSDINSLITGYKNQLTGLSLDIAGKGVELQEYHPDIKIDKVKIEALKKTIKDESARVITTRTKARSPIYDNLMEKSLDYELDLITQNIILKYNKALLKTYHKRLRELNGIDTKYNQLIVKSDNLLSLQKALSSKYMMAVIAEHLDVSNAVIIDRAVLPGPDNTRDYKAFPKTGKLLFLSVLFGSIIGFFAMMFIDAIDNKISTIEDISSTGEKILGRIPLVKSPDGFSEDPAKKEINSILSSLRLGADGALIIPVLSISPAEGRTTLAGLFSNALAKQGLRTCLAEAAPGEGPRSAQQQGAGNARPTPSGTSLPGLDRVRLNPHEAKDFLGELEKSYDAIVIDLPAMETNNSGATIVKAAGKALLLVKAGIHDRNALMHNIRHLKESGTRLLGVVLNFSRYDF